MAGVVDGLDPTEFRTGIRLAMQIGLQADVDDRPVFHYAEVKGTPTVPVDGEGVPFDLTQTVPVTTPSPVSGVPCAMEYSEATVWYTALGMVVPAKVILTFLDQDYALVRPSDGPGYEYVVIGGVQYTYSHSEIPQALGSVGVFRDHCVAGTDKP